MKTEGSGQASAQNPSTQYQTNQWGSGGDSASLASLNDALGSAGVDLKVSWMVSFNH